MDKSEYRKKHDDAKRKRQEAAVDSYRQQIIGALERIAQQNQATENQAQRADTFHRRVERLTFRFEGRKFWLELAETLGLWVAAGVGVAAIAISSHDSEVQTGVMLAQQKAMQGQLDEMKGTSAQTDKLLEYNGKLAEAASKQAQASIEAAKVANANYVATQRAWIGPTDANITPPVAHAPLKANILFGNSGRQPAPTVSNIIPKIYSIQDWNNGEAVKDINTFKNDCLQTPMNDQIARITFPTTGNTTFNWGYDGTQTNLRDTTKISVSENLVSGVEVVAFRGCFVYRTIDEIHRTSFCYFYQAKTTEPQHLQICTAGQAAN